MTAAHLATARHRTVATLRRKADIRAVLVEATADTSERVVVAFASDEDAEAWARAHVAGTWRVMPAELAAPRW